MLGKLLKYKELPEEEKNFQKNYVKASSFLSIHMGVKASVLTAGTDCHHFVLEVYVRFHSSGYSTSSRFLDFSSMFCVGYLNQYQLEMCLTG
jgi:hypothetical protein